MTPCARSCCWTPHCCARNRACPCHADERAPTSRNNGVGSHRDPTANEAIARVMRATRKETR